METPLILITSLPLVNMVTMMRASYVLVVCLMCVFAVVTVASGIVAALALTRATQLLESAANLLGTSLARELEFAARTSIVSAACVSTACIAAIVATSLVSKAARIVALVTNLFLTACAMLAAAVLAIGSFLWAASWIVRLATDLGRRGITEVVGIATEVAENPIVGALTSFRSDGGNATTLCPDQCVDFSRIPIVEADVCLCGDELDDVRALIGTAERDAIFGTGASAFAVVGAIILAVGHAYVIRQL